MLKGELDMDEVDAVVVGCALDYALGNLGVPMEVSWFGAQKSVYRHPLTREDITDPVLWANWELETKMRPGNRIELKQIQACCLEGLELRNTRKPILTFLGAELIGGFPNYCDAVVWVKVGSSEDHWVRKAPVHIMLSKDGRWWPAFTDSSSIGCLSKQVKTWMDENLIKGCCGGCRCDAD